MAELSSANEQLPIKLGFRPVFDKEVGEFELVSVSGEHLASSPVASDSIKLFTYQPSFGVNSFLPSFCKHKFCMRM
jgi:hypothetical protein